MRRHLLERGLRDADELVGAALADAEARDARDLEAAALEEMRLVLVDPAGVGRGDGEPAGAQRAQGLDDGRRGGQAGDAVARAQLLLQPLGGREHRAGGAGVGDRVDPAGGQHGHGRVEIGVQMRQPLRRPRVMQAHAVGVEGDARRDHARPFRLVDRIGRRHDQAQPRPWPIGRSVAGGPRRGRRVGARNRGGGGRGQVHSLANRYGCEGFVQTFSHSTCARRLREARPGAMTRRPARKFRRPQPPREQIRS